MNSFKTVIVVSVMAVVAYGVYASLTRGPIDPEAADADTGPTVELSAEESPAARLPAETGFAPKYAGNAAGSNAGTQPRARETEHTAHEEGVDDLSEGATTGQPARRAGSNRERYSSDAYSDTASTHEADPHEDGGYALAEKGDGPRRGARANRVKEDLSQDLDPPLPEAPDFAQAMQAIQAKLDRDQLPAAHLDLTHWYDMPELAEADRAQVETLLDQLAGTVIYDRQHHLLEPAYVVQEGDTLPQIAANYDVPWQLLAKINGINDPQYLQAGQQLKVLRGPFDAVLDLGAFRLTLLLDGCYAGQFQCGVGKDHVTREGEYTVRMKVENPDYYGPGGTVQADDPNNPLGRYWLHLSDEVSIHGTNDPASIGRAGGLGSVRLRPDDIEHVFDILSVGSRVVIRR